MFRNRLSRYFIFATVLATGLAYGAQNDTQQGISVKSKESQHGQVLGEVDKKGIPGAIALEPMKVQNGDKEAMHKARQAASPLTRPVDPDLRIVEMDPDFWIYDAVVYLDVDRDYDGFFSSFTVEFDADTVYSEAQVYARLYLARGEVFEEYHTTSLFYINGDSSSDSFVVESDLVTGFPTGDYEMLIELYDTYDNKLVAFVDGYSDADLSYISLESQSYEETEVVIVTEHGGSFGFLTLLLVPVLVRRIFFK